MLEKAKEVTRTGKYIHLDYATLADDLMVLVDGFRKWRWLIEAAMWPLCQELVAELNTENTKAVGLSDRGILSFLGYHFRHFVKRSGKNRCSFYVP